MMMRSIFLAAFVAVCAAQCDGITVHQGVNGVCPSGTGSLVSNTVLTQCTEHICGLLDEWEIARGESQQLSGSGYGCAVGPISSDTADAICQSSGGGGGGSSGGSSGGGMSGGAIFMIIFFVGFAVYFAAGAAYMKFVKGNTGSEIIPHVAFWKDLPALMKDGALFIKHKVSGGGYQSV